MILNVPNAPFDRHLFTYIEGHAEKEIVLTLGTASYIGGINITIFPENPIPPHILAGRFCSFADGICFSIGGNHNYKSVSSFPFDMENVFRKIFSSGNPLPYIRPNRYQAIIGHDVWIGRNVTVAGGVKIGNGAVIGENAVVAKNIPPYAIAVGNPARVIKYRFDEETIRKLLAVKWWNWSLQKIADNLPLMNDVEKFLEKHYSPELGQFAEDDLSRRLNTGGGFVFINLFLIFALKIRYGLRL